LIEIVFRHGLRVGGLEFGGLVQVVRGVFLCESFVFGRRGVHGEFGLGWPPGGMDERGRSGLTDVGEGLGDRFRVGEDRDEREGCLAGWADEG
jgi:hypothetical protein